MVQMDTQQRARLASTGLAHAAGEKQQRAKVLSTLLQAGAEPRGQHGEIALRNAARDGQAESMQLLLHEGTDVNAVDDDGKTVLCVAACSGCCEGVRCLLEHGAQVRMRCHDGREPLDFAVDEAVRQLLLAEVEKLRMGLLDELLADEEAEGGKGKGKKGKKAKKGAEPEPSTVKKGAKDGKPAPAESAAPSSAAAVGDSTGGEAAEPQVQSKSAKKKQKKASKAAAGAGPASTADEAAVAGADDPDAGAATPAAVEPTVEAEVAKSPRKKTAKGAAGVAGAPCPPKDGESAKGISFAPSLVEAAVQLLRGQAEGPSMRISSLVSALYDLSAAFKEEIKSAGGAKLWLSDHSDEFVVVTDCSPGHESVMLRSWPGEVADPPHHGDAGGDTVPPSAVVPNGTAGNGAAGHGGTGNGAGVNSKGDDRITESSCHSEGSDDADVAHAPHDSSGHGHAPHTLSLADDAELHDHGFRRYPYSWDGTDRAIADAADDAAAAALLGAASEESTNDPILIEKKIRAVQKKLRRVQTIEELVAQGSSLDNGQQALFASKPRLQSQLHQLLQQWAVLEPVLLEQQEQRMLAIANSECAICLEEYDADRPGIRTSCCGYHFHRRCLQQCLDTAGLCPICSASKGACKVVEQRVRSAQ